MTYLDGGAGLFENFECLEMRAERKWQIAMQKCVIATKDFVRIRLRINRHVGLIAFFARS